MELSSDNLFSFVIRRYKQKENKDSRESNPRLLKRQNSPKKEEKIIKSFEIVKYFHSLIINNSNISNILYNSVNPFIKECFDNLEFLSITNNYIRNLDFILHLPNLFFLDLFGNPLEEFNALNNKNLFGYLRLSIELFNEKKVLNIFDLKCGILDIDLKDKNTMRIFNMNNNHISMINNEVIYIIDKIKNEEIKIKSLARKKEKKSHLSTLSNQSNSIADLSNSDIKKYSSDKKVSEINHLTKNLSINIKDNKNEYIAEKPIENIMPKNPFLLKINKYFKDYQSEIDKAIKTENSNKRNLLIYNKYFSSQNFIQNQLYLNREKEKLILLFEIYKKISIFNRGKNNNEYLVGNIYNINVNEHIDKIFVKEIKDNIKNHSQKPRNSVIILIAILLYTIGSISEKMMSAIINYILTKYYDYDENQEFPDFSNLGDIHYLSFYYSTYNYIYKRMIDNEKNISIDKYKDILKILQMDKLILKSNYLYKKLKKSKSKDNKAVFCEFKKIKINNEIKSLKELNITKEFLVLIEFLCDYTIYEKIEDILINNSFPGEYSYLIELKETLEESEFQINNNDFKSSSLSALKFQKNKKERIFNKFYFEKDKIKQITNKDFKKYVFNNNNKSRTLNNFSIPFGNSSIFNSSFSNFNFNNINNNNEDNEYKKADDIEIDEFFYIDNKGKNSSYKIQGKKQNFNISLYKKDRENDYLIENSSEDENNTSIRLPNLYPNQNPFPYEEFEFLKRMIFDPDFLSQHARNVIKFEKQKKKLRKKFQNLNIRKNMNIRKIEGTKSIYARSKTNEKGNLCITNNENNTTKNNKISNDKLTNKINFESNNNENSSNNSKHKIIINTTNSNLLKNQLILPNHYKSTNKINLKNFISKENKNIIERNNKTVLAFDRKCNMNKHKYKGPFFEIPESFPGITLLNFGIKKNKSLVKKIKFYTKKSISKEVIKENNNNNKKSYKEQVMSKIKQTVKNNILRNARRVACSFNQNY